MLTNKRRSLVRPSCIDNNLMGCVPTGRNARFIYILFQAIDLGEHSKPGPVPAISEGEVREIRVVYPPESERPRLVRFLDHTDRRIRRYIRSRQKLISLLKEQKQAIINRAVTRGLDPNVRLKPSGFDWLGDVPEHWIVCPLKRVAWFKSGTGFPVSEQGKDGFSVPFFRVSDMNQTGNERLMKEISSTVSEETAKRLKAYVFPARAIIFPKVGGALLTNKRRLLVRPSCIDNNLMGCVFTTGDLEYNFMLMGSIDLGRLSKPGPVPALSEEEVRQIPIAVPPMNEQKRMVARVNERTKVLDLSIVGVTKEIALFREFRSRLISDVVTGKLDVREAAAQLPDEPYEFDEPDESEWANDVQDDEEPDDLDEISEHSDEIQGSVPEGVR